MRRAVLLGVLLLLTAVLVPDSGVREPDLSMVRMPQAAGIDADRRQVIWILGVGSDARRGQDMNRSRGDAIQLVALNPRTGAASAIGVPRDSWVPIPGHGKAKIDAALQYGGPQGMARAVGALLGVRVDYVVVTRFPFFENMINDIGGITVRNPRAFADPHLRPKGFKRGELRLDGYAAMGFSRIRKSLPGGDFDRSANQQRVLRGIQQALADRADRPGFIERAVATTLRHTSSDLSPREMFRLAQAIVRVKPGKVRTCVLRGGVGWVGPQSVVFPDRAQARRLGEDAGRDGALRRC